ncbi:methyltransferase domain-containing protein, partial [Candidatus Fermentibacteria bacterium]|nr:methyltransferase domain-containing protein [Candidatus Fermentibacteria bacterium]
MRSMRDFHQRIIPPDDSVMQARCGTGDLLAAVRPVDAVGIEPDPFFASLCRARHPEITLIQEEVAAATPQARFRYAIACHLLEQEDDCLKAVHSLGRWLVPRGRLIFTFLNPLWAPVVRLCELFGLRPRDRRYNYLTARDVTNLCLLAGYDVVEEGYKVFCPLPIPLLTPFL